MAIVAMIADTPTKMKRNGQTMVVDVTGLECADAGIAACRYCSFVTLPTHSDLIALLGAEIMRLNFGVSYRSRTGTSAVQVRGARRAVYE